VKCHHFVYHCLHLGLSVCFTISSSESIENKKLKCNSTQMVGFTLMVFNATFNIILVISWQSVLLVEDFSKYCCRPLWSWSYGSWIYIYLCNQCLSQLMLWAQISIRARCTTLCDKVCQWLATGIIAINYNIMQENQSCRFCERKNLWSEISSLPPPPFLKIKWSEMTSLWLPQPPS
jgi:hypothetical protein